MSAGLIPASYGHAFPTLGEAVLNRIRPFGTVLRVERKCEIDDFAVVLDGELRFQAWRDGGFFLDATLEHGQFSGELVLLGQGVASTTARACVSSSVLVFTQEQLRELLKIDHQVADIIVRAFIYRRLSLISKVAVETDVYYGRRGLRLTYEERRSGDSDI